MHVALVSQNADLTLDIRPREEARTLAEAGFNVTLIGPAKDGKAARRAVDARVRLEVFGLPRPAHGVLGQVREQATAFVLAAAAVRRVAARRQIDFLHVGNPPDNGWLLITAARLGQRRRPVFVFDQHDVSPVLLVEKFGEQGLRAVLARAATWLERRSFERADLVVFANSGYLSRARSGGLPVARAAVVPNGWSLNGGSRRLDRGSSDIASIAYIGAINEQDHVDHLVDAVAAMATRRVRVVVAGGGSALEAVRARARFLGIDGSFDWLGWVASRETLASLVKNADVCVVPELDSAFNRLASLVKLGEYMSAGAAIVAHRLPQTESMAGDTVEYAGDMTAGALAEAVDRLLNDPDRRRELGRRAAQRFSQSIAWEAVGSSRLSDAYRALIAEQAAHVQAGAAAQV